MTDDPVKQYNEAVSAVAQTWAKEYASLPPGDFAAHKRALELAEQQRSPQQTEAADFKRKVSRMSHGELERYKRDNGFYD